jgi:hypothetical protein
MSQFIAGFFKRNTSLAVLLSVIPPIIYILAFRSIALNVNYIAFDDILILGVIPGFAESSWLEKWQRLTALFPEHRLVFSRSVILLLHSTFGRLNLVWAMIIANICWAGCAFVFYKAFKKLHLSFWYFVPIMWLWFNFQSFENIFWGVSSLCNFGVLLFVITSFYFAAYHPKRIIYALPFALLATFTYGNGLMSFPIIAILCLLSAQRKAFFVTLATMALVAFIYFIDFSPITQNINLSDPKQVKEGVMGFFGFIGSFVTLAAYTSDPFTLMTAVCMGVLMTVSLLILFRKQWSPIWKSIWHNKPYTQQGALFAIALAAFILITSLALTYKRIPTDHFEGMFKGRYRMYSTLALISIYFCFLSLTNAVLRRQSLPYITAFAITLNLVILHSNFADAVTNRRDAVTQEFNSRYNADWLGTKMFSMDRAHLEKIRSYYSSEDPLAANWNPAALSNPIKCDSIYNPDVVALTNDHLRISYTQDFFSFVKNYTDGGYVILKSDQHVYAAALNHQQLPLKTTLRRQMYFTKDTHANFHTANLEPGNYKIYLLKRESGVNRIYCTTKTWHEE